MKIKGIIFEDFVNYKVPSMFISFPSCTFKCDRECGRSVCQNSSLVRQPDIYVDKNEIIEKYLSNPLTEAIVLGGLEPFDSDLDLLPFIDTLRRQYKCDDTVVIYTGYTEEELNEGEFGIGNSEQQRRYWNAIKKLPNIVVKFGRFIPGQDSHFDEVLGVNLASPNQYAKIVSEKKENE